MTEVEWLASESPLLMIRAVQERVGARKWRLFCCGLCRGIWDEIADARCRAAVEVAERYADGQADAHELSAAGSAVSRFRAECDEARRLDAAAGPFRWVVPVLYALRPTPLPTEAIGQARPAPRDGESTDERYARARARNVALLRDILGNPFRTVNFSPEWRTDTVLALVAQMYDSRDFGAMPILADALQDAGCESDDILNHCRGDGPHVRGCWVVDRVVGKE